MTLEERIKKFYKAAAPENGTFAYEGRRFVYLDSLLKHFTDAFGDVLTGKDRRQSDRRGTREDRRKGETRTP